MKNNKLSKKLILSCVVAISFFMVGGVSHSESLSFTGQLKTMLPEVTVTNSNDPVSDVKDVTISVNQNAGICNITSNTAQAMRHGSKPVCRIEWDDPRGLSAYLNTLNGVVSGSGDHEFTYTLTMYDLDTFDPIHSDSYTVNFSAPVLPDAPVLTSNWQIKEDSLATTHDLYNRNEQHLSLAAQLTPRNYDQVIRFGDLACTIPEGQSSCTIPVGEKFDANAVPEITGTKLYDYTVTDPYAFINQPATNYVYNWDFRPPTIIATHVNVSSTLMPSVISEYGESVVLYHNQAAVVIESPHDIQDEAFYPTDPTLKVRLDTQELYVTDIINFGGIPIEFDLGTLYGDQLVDIAPINDPLRIGPYLIYVYDFSHIRDGLYDFTFSTEDGNANGEEETINDIYIDRYPPDIQFVINKVHHTSTSKPNVYSLSDITILAWGGWDDGATITSATLNGEPVSFETGTNNVKRLQERELPMNSQHYLSVTAQDATGNEFTKLLDFNYGNFSFAVTVDDVMQNIQPAKVLLRQTAGPYCVTTTSPELAQMYSAQYIESRSRGCTVEWLIKPNGLDATQINSLSRSTTILSQGLIAEPGVHPYHFRVHSYDAFGGSQIVFEGMGDFEVTALESPELIVGPLQIAANFDSYRHAVPEDRKLSILATVKAKTGSDIVVELYDDSGELVSKEVMRDVGAYARHTFRPDSLLSLNTAYDYKVRAYYLVQPENYIERAYDFYTVPGSDVRLTLEHQDYVMQGNSIEVLAKMGQRQSDNVSYDESMGQWNIGFFTYNSELRSFEPLSTTVDTDVSGISRISVTSEQIITNQNKFFARAKLITPYPEINITRRLSALYNVPVLSLGGISASLTSTEFVSPIPARFVAKIDYETMLDSSTAGDIIWQSSPDGDTWTELDRKRGLVNYLFTFDDPSELFVRAIVVNRLSGEYNYTNTAHFIAKPLPTIEVSGSHLVALGGLGVFEYTLNEYAQNNSNGVVQYSINNRATWNEMSPVQNLELTTATNLIVRTLIQPSGETPYYIYDEKSVSILPPRSLNLTFRADVTAAESGDKVNLASRFTSNSLYDEADYRYEMIMPDGSRHDTLSHEYTLAESDFSSGQATFLFRSWVDGLELETSETKSVSVEQIIYDQLPPTELIVQTPERVRFSFVNVRMIKPKSNTIPSSVKIEEDILLPAGGQLELSNRTPNIFRLLAKEEGTHPIRVRYFDNRGNERWHTEFVTITAPPEIRFDMKTRYYTENFRPPFRFSNSLSYRFGSPTDRLDRIEWYINDELLFSNKRTIINQTLEQAGDYKITTKIFSVYGQTAEVTESFTLEENKTPICEPYWEQRDRVKTLFANCTDYDGKIRRVGFTYLADADNESTTYRYFNPSMSFVEGFYDDSIPVQMTALDDSDAVTTLEVSWPQGE